MELSWNSESFGAKFGSLSSARRSRRRSIASGAPLPLNLWRHQGEERREEKRDMMFSKMVQTVSAECTNFAFNLRCFQRVRDDSYGVIPKGVLKPFLFKLNSRVLSMEELPIQDSSVCTWMNLWFPVLRETLLLTSVMSHQSQVLLTIATTHHLSLSINLLIRWILMITHHHQRRNHHCQSWPPSQLTIPVQHQQIHFNQLI